MLPKRVKNIVLLFVMIYLGINLFSIVHAAEEIDAKFFDFLLSDGAISGYYLESQYQSTWPVSPTESADRVRQTWISNDENTSVTLSVCIFNSEEEAIRGTQYYTITTAEPWLWGSLFDGIVGSQSWRPFNYDNSILFAYGNISVLIGRHKEDDPKIIPLLAKAQIEKIKQNLAPEIIQQREELEVLQISSAEYNNYLAAKVDINLNGFTQISNEDSLWLMQDEGLVMGIRREWQNNSGEVVGVDICKLESNEIATEVASEREDMTHDFLVTGLGAINWEGSWSSDVSVFGNVVIHLYSFKSQKISQNTTNKSASSKSLFSYSYYYNSANLWNNNNYSLYPFYFSGSYNNFSGFYNNMFNDLFFRYPYSMNVNLYNPKLPAWGNVGFSYYNRLSHPFSCPYSYKNFWLDYPFYIR